MVSLFSKTSGRPNSGVGRLNSTKTPLYFPETSGFDITSFCFGSPDASALPSEADTTDLCSANAKSVEEAKATIPLDMKSQFISNNDL